MVSSPPKGSTPVRPAFGSKESFEENKTVLSEFVIVIDENVTAFRQRAGEVAGEPERKRGSSGIFAAEIFEAHNTRIRAHERFDDPVPVACAAVPILTAQ